MKKQTAVKRNQKSDEKFIQQAIKANGFLFPVTVSEVIEFEKKFGDTEIILPDELQEPLFLTKTIKNSGSTKSLVLKEENLAMAARDGSEQISDEIRKKMDED